MWLLLIIVMGASSPEEVIPVHTYYKLEDCQHDVNLVMSNPETGPKTTAGCVRLEGLMIT